MAPKQSKALQKFDIICKEISHFKDSVENCSDNDTNRIVALKTKLKGIESRFSEAFSDLSVREADDNLDEYLKFQDEILNLTVELSNKSVSVSNENKTNVDQTRNTGCKTGTRLPELSLQIFYGDENHWTSFKELFQNSVLNNGNLTEVEKLQYLFASVRGNAAKIIRGFSIQSENLKHCWELLNQRYEDKTQLAFCHINKIFSIRNNKVNNAKTFLEVLDSVNEAVRNLENIGLKLDSLSELMIISLSLTKLDDATKLRWNLTLDKNTFPSLDKFRTFIHSEARAVSNLTPTLMGNESLKRFGRDNNQKRADAVETINNRRLFKTTQTLACQQESVANNKFRIREKNNCLLCSESQIHPLYKCSIFNQMQVNDRIKFIDENMYCRNCLRNNHIVSNCRVKSGCKNCSSNAHHTLLHIYNVDNTNAPTSDNSIISITNTSQTQSSVQTTNVLLSTALINVTSKSGEFIQLKAIIDGGSQSSLISRECVDRLKLPLRKTSHRLLGINGVPAETSLFMTNVTFSPHFGTNTFQVEALVVNKVTPPLPNFCVQNRNWPHIQNLQLADPQFHVAGPIDLLIGCDLYPHLLTGAPITGSSGTPVAIPSKLGFLLTGKVKEQTTLHTSIICHSTNSQINDTLKAFWNIEDIPQTNQFPDENQLCEEIYSSSVSRNSTGRYVVNLPLTNEQVLGDSKQQAIKRFCHLENKFKRDGNFCKEYSAFMKEYIDLNHMMLVSSDQTSTNQIESNSQEFYLPHHGVRKDDSTTTRLRVVFDASSKSSNGTSLNDILHVGPKLQTSIFELLTQFRTFRVAFSADVEKMFRQILINPEHTKYQKILWRFSPEQPIDTYKLMTVTYGTACAPFLANRTLKQLSIDSVSDFPEAAEIVGKNFYVDDLLTGAHSVSEAKSLIADINRILSQGGFTLRKWSSNFPEILADLPEEVKSTTYGLQLEEDRGIKLLGIYWNAREDVMQIRISDQCTVTTKRQLLSVIARTFDPLGLIAPATILLKVLLQDIWKADLAWDDTIPSEILTQWDRFKSEMHHFKQIKIPRYIKTTLDSVLELHGFCDASLKAYAAVVYLKVNCKNTHVSLITGKTRVAPVQPVTLPRLELQGALLLSELVTAVLKIISVPNRNIFLWCDSTITLSWISNPPKQGNPFVKHRVGKIRSLTSKFAWNHIPGIENPADCASRGLFPEQLRAHSDWFAGPKWLYDHNDYSQSHPATPLHDHDLPTAEDISLVTQTAEPPNAIAQLIAKSSSYLKLLRVTAWIIRFIQNTRSTTSQTKGSLLAQEIDHARNIIVKYIQQEEFSSDIKLINTNKPLSTSSKLISLNVFLDKEGILRVGGRLSKHQTLPFDHKFPMLLPKKHPVTSAVIRYYHQTSLHSGPEMVLSLIRQSFWIPDGRSTVRHELRSCLRCLKHSARPIQQRMGDLPVSRITASRPFERTGIDFAGPINTKCQHIRKATTFKSYICLFICMSTRAVHLEAVSSLSTDAFLASLRRFVARRGCPSELFSDNGSNFLGASTYLKALFKLPKEQSVQDFSSQRNIRWHFIPPYAPNMGGLWEASIKLAKRHLSKTCQGTLLNFEELSTVLCQIEACVNSRPLIPLSTATNDLRALTPGHFLIGAPLLEIPEGPTHTNPTSSLSCRWKLILQMKEAFWKRWTRDLLHTLQPRQKWHHLRHPLQVGDLVLLQGPAASPGAWNLGRITKIFPGDDGITRVASIKTNDGERLRATNRIVVLPFVSSRPPEDVAQRSSSDPSR